MVINQGMGTKLRDQVFHVDEGMMMERSSTSVTYSDDTAKVIDDEVEALITEAGERARAVIKANMTSWKPSRTACWKKKRLKPTKSWKCSRAPVALLKLIVNSAT
jgi:ATP-dependent Zn protease